MNDLHKAKVAAFEERNDAPYTPKTSGDFSHIQNIQRLVEGVRSGLDPNTAGHKRAINLLDQASGLYGKAAAAHDNGHWQEAAGHAGQMELHLTQAANMVAPTSPEDAADNYDPYLTSALGNTGHTNVDEYLKSAQGVK